MANSKIKTIQDFERRIEKIGGYDYEDLKCPFCGEWNYAKTIKFHIAKKAKWCKKHNDFYLKNTEIIKVRKWKNNNSI